ncbi:hypothetical protein JD844_001719 [Phrynosoma platyrhinos]|uniref:Receptor ligand binding region domain-containing protein n=1 Tax=Phrynosoma platyrhinos TaxID=52577 RepID=A0ABQ7TB20_PHRPL|nr:hypothetical protein JD844_001719 [Phrynosoma platyrhinos]
MSFEEHPRTKLINATTAVPKNYQHVLAFLFAVKELNDNPNILPNVSLGFHICDSYYNAKMTYMNTLNLLFNVKKIIPNYNCELKRNVMAVIGGLDSETSLHIANFLNIYKIPQITYSFFAPLMNDNVEFPFIYQMVPREADQYRGLVQLFLHFQWTWVGIIAIEDEKGERFVQTFLPLLLKNGICAAFIDWLPALKSTADMIDLFYLSRSRENMTLFLTNINVQVYTVHADTLTALLLKWFLYLTQMEDLTEMVMGKVWVMTMQWEFSFHLYYRNLDIDFFHGALSFTVNSCEVLEFENFLHDLNFQWPKGDGFIRVFWTQAFGCLLPDTELDMFKAERCTGEEKLESLPGTFFEMSMTAQSYSIYNAVHALGKALHAMNSARQNYKSVVACGGSLEPHYQQPWQLQPFLRSISFNNSAGDTIYFNKKGELATGFDIINWVTFPNKSFIRVKVGKMDPQAPPGTEFTINEKRITWPKKFNQIWTIVSHVQDTSIQTGTEISAFLKF